jgi:hypothetical protein
MSRSYTSSPPFASIHVLWDCFTFTFTHAWICREGVGRDSFWHMHSLCKDCEEKSVALRTQCTRKSQFEEHKNIMSQYKTQMDIKVYV